MSRDYTIKNALHRDPAISILLDTQGGKHYLSVIQLLPSTPTITTVTTTNANWTALGTGLTNVLQWRVSELLGKRFHYAYVAAPGNNFSVGYGWISMNTALSSIYVARPSTANITLKLELWRA